MRLRRRSGTKSTGQDTATEAFVAIDPTMDRGSAFSTFYDTHAAPILRYCLVRIADVHDAEDVAAQIFLQAWHAFPPDDRGSQRSWLFTIAHHSVVNYYRRQGARAPSRPLDDDLAGRIPDHADSPETIALRREAASTLHTTLQLLPPDQRQVVELRLAGLRASEIATVIGRSEGAVKMIQFRAMSRLRLHLVPNAAMEGDQPTTRREHADATQ
jgi:RNA polymerase sigma-70 factor (ECF subfamily)